MQNLNANDALSQTALTGLTAGGGGDLPEGQIFALQQVATATSWRAGSQRILIWVGDAPGHNPSNGATEASAIAALAAQGIIVIAASSTSGPGLNAACSTLDCTAGQATRIAAGAAAGSVFLGTFSDATINAQIQTAITNAIAMYSKVSLQVSPVPAGVTVNISPASITGTFDRSILRTFNFTVTFTGTFPGNYPFNINALIDDVQALTDRGLPVQEVDNITVTALPPVISKGFNPLYIRPGGTSTLTFTIQNPNLAIMPGVAFLDTLPTGVTVVAIPAATNSCGGVLTAAGGVVNLAGGSIAASSTCTITVTVTSNEGIKNNATNNVTSAFGTGNVATARLVAALPPTISKAFGVAVIPLNGVTTLTFSIGNPNATVPLTAVSVVDNLPAGLKVATPSVVVNTCGGAVTALAGSGSISLAGGAIAAASTCTITVNVTGVIPGLQINVTDPITSLEGGTNGVATARITVGGNFLISYAANLTNGDSVVNLTNTGALGASLNGPGFGGAAGNICMNVYAFSPDEQLVACCSCLITPNGLAALSIKDDLISNTLTGVRPNSVVVKVVPMEPVQHSLEPLAPTVQQ